jgi:tetratricopeptide (TPR) repeat protein
LRLRKPGPLAFTVLLFGAMTPLLLAQEKDIEDKAARAVGFHQAGKLEEAVELYGQILAAAPEALRIRSNLGAAYAGLGRFDEAIAEYRKALEGRDDPSIRLNLVRALHKAGRPEEAATEAEVVLTAVPGHRDTALLLADCRLRLGQDLKVVELLEPAAKAAPDDKAVAFLLGSALLNLDRATDAQQVMDRLFRDGSAEAHVLMGTLHSRRGEFALALAEFERARASNPSLPLVSFLLASCLMEQGDWAGAGSAFRRELEIDPNHYESNLMLANLLRKEGKHEEALPFVLRASKLRKDDLGCMYSLGATYLALGRTDEAKALLEAVAAAVPDHLHTHMQLAILYVRLGRKEDAARERATAARLQKEADARVFDGVKEQLGGMLGKTELLPEPGVAKR